MVARLASPRGMTMPKPFRSAQAPSIPGRRATSAAAFSSSSLWSFSKGDLCVIGPQFHGAPDDAFYHPVCELGDHDEGHERKGDAQDGSLRSCAKYPLLPCSSCQEESKAQREQGERSSCLEKLPILKRRVEAQDDAKPLSWVTG
jgi:hypothetical protein